MQHKIIAYREENHDQLVDIWHRAVRQTHTFLSEEDIQFYHHIISNGALRELEVWMECTVLQEPIGFIGLDGQKIEMLFVDPEWHGQGTGSRLIQHAEKIKGTHLKVDVNEQNEKAHAFYRHYGFVPTGRSALDGSRRAFPLLHMELNK
ncbi:GNAT family N-acetyltransferase [Paenibacillus polymyxa]|uniref:GNAT family acetyltransferase n=1 Tax=Paenibacillus polymyxa (strain SC2) TaxID=886882 RepID=E3EG68_PAEPS|nr:GNAT family N-acetyltransferase [Paenibacillus polymyxa]ADO56261.1 GNAT family acetyltransferase [Paenibacillus polymyxa SC2]WPQ58939.1 GNAT family N-acetyltransferase [Paenibacillus polymyxa]CCC84996.1 putative acetyltransferase [Paenibacillus polymyxa M1]